MKIITVKNLEKLNQLAAEIIAEQVKGEPRSVLGFATGSSPVGTYKKLIDLNKSGVLDFSDVTSFNLDEYCGVPCTDSQSYHYFMMDKLFSHININKKNINIPNGTAKNFAKECDQYEKKIMKAGGIDLQILGVGNNGHIGFNEPDTVFYNKTRQVALTTNTINANKRFFACVDDVPKTALSMGTGTIMAARKILLVAGPEKREIINQLKQDTVSPQLPVSILHYHPDCTIIFAEGE